MKLFVLLLVIAMNTFADSGCLEIEGINIGCVSSVDHSCFINKAVDMKNSTCYYVGSPSTMMRTEGPIAWSCKSSKNTTVCSENKGNGDQSGTSCHTVSECLEYSPPICNETCVSCFDQIVAENVGVTKGCIICTRKPCADEVDRLSKSSCPLYNSAGMPLGNGIKCSAGSRCPKSATPPNGGAPMAVTVNTGSCGPAELPKPQATPTPLLCPWKVDTRSDAGCEPIAPENKNP